MAGAGRSGDDGPRFQDDLLAVGAVTGLRDDHGHDRVADSDAGRHALADLVDDSGGIHARDIGRRVELLLLGAGAVARHDIRRVYGCGIYP